MGAPCTMDGQPKASRDLWVTYLTETLSPYYEIPKQALHNSVVLRAAASVGMYEEAVEILLEMRRQRLASEIRQQRTWQARVSRRPRRGKHWDSWAIRENYVACRRLGREWGRGRNHTLARALWEAA